MNVCVCCAGSRYVTCVCVLHDSYNPTLSLFTSLPVHVYSMPLMGIHTLQIEIVPYYLAAFRNSIMAIGHEAIFCFDSIWQ